MAHSVCSSLQRNQFLNFRGYNVVSGKNKFDRGRKVSFFAFILRLTMTSVFDRQEGRKSERDELATEVADDARDFCK